MVALQSAAARRETGRTPVFGALPGGWAAGDFLNGRGLLGLTPPADGRMFQRSPASKVATHYRAGLRKTVAPPSALGQFANGFGSGFVGEFKDQAGATGALGRQVITHPVQSASAVARLTTLQGQVEAGGKLVRQAVSGAAGLAHGYQAAARSRTLPYFFGNIAGHGAALGLETAATDGLLDGAGVAARGAARLLPNALEDAALDAGPSAAKIPTIGGRKPINWRYAGKVHPSGVRFTEQGFPDFRPHAKHEVKLEGLTGKGSKDRRMANRAAGLKTEPPGYEWHHVEDMKTMQLIPKKIHKATPHTGGRAVIRNGGFDP